MSPREAPPWHSDPRSPARRRGSWRRARPQGCPAAAHRRRPARRALGASIGARARGSRCASGAGHRSSGRSWRRGSGRRCARRSPPTRSLVRRRGAPARTPARRRRPAARRTAGGAPPRPRRPGRRAIGGRDDLDDPRVVAREGLRPGRDRRHGDAGMFHRTDADNQRRPGDPQPRRDHRTDEQHGPIGQREHPRAHAAAEAPTTGRFADVAITSNDP